MKTLAEIRHDLATGRYELTQQAFRQAIEQDIGDEDVRHAGDHAVILEEFSTAESGANCLLGYDDTELSLHLLVSRAEREIFCCQNCGSETAVGDVVDEIFRIAGSFVLVENIPASICNACGERLFSPVTTARLQILLRSTTQPLKRFNLIAYSY